MTHRQSPSCLSLSCTLCIFQRFTLQILEEAASSTLEESRRGDNGRASTSEFDELSPGSRKTIALPHQPKEKQDRSPRFWATVLDVSGIAADAAVQRCCVFLVPQVSPES